MRSVHAAYLAHVIRPFALIHNAALHGPGRVLGSGGVDPNDAYRPRPPRCRTT